MEDGRQTFVEALLGKEQEKEIENLSRDSLGIAENQTLRKMEDFGKQDLLMLPGNHTGGDTGTSPSMDKEKFLDFSTVKTTLEVYIKDFQAERTTLEVYITC